VAATSRSGIEAVERLSFDLRWKYAAGVETVVPQLG
jgi:hypothetical protein